MPPAKGAAPLWTPRLRGLRLNSGVHHPPGPPYFQEGGPVKESSIWRHILQTSCQRGGAPLDSPLAGAATQ